MISLLCIYALAEEYYSEERGRTLSADDVVEIVMHIYVPEGALRAGVRSGRKSTWLNPVVDGVEAVRLLHEPLVSRNRQVAISNAYDTQSRNFKCPVKLCFWYY